MRENIGWTESECRTCEKEKGEFINNLPPCFSGQCKHFGNLKNVPQGDLRQFKVGIERFLEVAAGLTVLCPLDANGYPAVPPSEIRAYGRTVDLDEEMFFELFEIYLGTVQKNISDQRKRERLKNG